MKKLLLFLLLAVVGASAYINPADSMGISDFGITLPHTNAPYFYVGFSFWLPPHDTIRRDLIRNVYIYNPNVPYDTVLWYDFTVNGGSPILMSGSMQGGDANASDGSVKTYWVWSGWYSADWAGKYVTLNGDTAMVDTNKVNQMIVNLTVYQKGIPGTGVFIGILSDTLYFGHPHVSVTQKPKVLVHFQPKTPEYFDALGRKVVSFTNSGLYLSKGVKSFIWKTQAKNNAIDR